MTARALDRIAARIRENVRKKPDGDIDVPREREVFDAMGQIAQLAPGTKVEPHEHGEIVVPERSDGERAVVYFHGGAFCLGTPLGYRALLSHVARACRAPVFSVEYRLAPEHPFPAAPDDALAAWRAITSTDSNKRYVMMGDSAGGNLTLGTLVRARDEGLRLPDVAVMISPWLDLDHTGESIRANAEADPLVREGDSRAHAKLYYGERSPRDPRVSPLFADLRGLPPLYVQVGRDECLLDDSTRLVTLAREAGVDLRLEVFDDVFHVWHFFAGIASESDDAIARIGEIVRAQ